MRKSRLSIEISPLESRGTGAVFLCGAFILERTVEGEEEEEGMGSSWMGLKRLCRGNGGGEGDRDSKGDGAIWKGEEGERLPGDG